MSWEYIAGFFDGEGHCALHPQKNNGEGYYSRGSVRVTMVQSLERGRELLEEIGRFLDTRGITNIVEVHHPGDERCRKSYHMRITGFKGAIAFLVGVFPYLRIKKVEAQDLIRYSKAFPSLQGKGHSHSDNVKKAWETRRRLYVNGYKRSESPSINGSLGCAKRWANHG